MKNKDCIYDYLIVGSGLYGAAFAFLARKAGKRCLVIDKRSHAGGNLYCENTEGINVHKYGPHIYHTVNERVNEFLSRFTEWTDYQHKVLANIHGTLMKVFNI